MVPGLQTTYLCLGRPDQSFGLVLDIRSNALPSDFTAKQKRN